MEYEIEGDKLVLTREQIADIALDIGLNEQKGVSKALLGLIETIARMQQVLELLRADKRCFCSMPVCTVPCKKATEILKLLNAH